MFGIPALEKTTFRNDFINNVIVRGNFNNNRSCAEHRQALKNRYADLLPIQSDTPQQQYNINVDVKTNQTSVNANVDENERQVILRSRNMQRELILTNNEFQYQESGPAYGTSVTFNNAVSPTLDFLEEVGVATLNKLRLRKVNVVGFELNASDPTQPVNPWQPAADLINERLTAQYQAMMGAASFIRQHFNTLQFEEGDYFLSIKYGFNVLEKNIEGSRANGQVIIDLEITRNSAITVTEALNELHLMHQELYNAFNWSISDSFVSLLNQEGVA